MKGCRVAKNAFADRDHRDCPWRSFCRNRRVGTKRTPNGYHETRVHYRSESLQVGHILLFAEELLRRKATIEAPVKITSGVLSAKWHPGSDLEKLNREDWMVEELDEVIKRVRLAGLNYISGKKRRNEIGQNTYERMAKFLEGLIRMMRKELG